MTRQRIVGTAWILLYIFLAALPVVVMLAAPRPPGRELWREASVALGFAGLALMALQFAVTARFRVLKAPYGSDIVYHFHRQISIVAFALIFAHPIMLFVGSPGTLNLLNLVTAPTRARLGVIGVIVFLAVIVLSVWRAPFGVEYRVWRIGHGLLATVALTAALIHIILVGYYLGTPWKRYLWIAYIVAWVALLLWTRVLDPLLQLRRPYIVKEVRPEREETWSLALEPQGHKGFRFQPGQFAWLTARTSPFGQDDHPFSFSSSAERPGYYEFGIRELGDFTATVKHFKPGERVYLDAPFGAFSCDRHPKAERYVFIAGGIGITPVISMLRTLADRGDRRPLMLLYANRSLERASFYEDLEELKGRLNLEVVHVLSRPDPGWEGESGRIDVPLLCRYLHDRKDEAEVFVCGPDALIDAVEDHLSEIGLHIRNVHSERFNLV